MSMDDGSIVNSQRVVSYSALKGYARGENQFTIIGENFANVNLLTLYVNNVPHNVHQQLPGSKYVWKFDDPRKQQSYCYLRITYNGNKVFPLNGISINYELVKPIIYSISPEQSYAQNLETLTINGQNFMINVGNVDFQDPSPPTVYLCQTALAIVSFTDTVIKCTIPNQVVGIIEYCPLSISMYSGVNVMHSITFKYYPQPIITGYNPARALSSLPVHQLIFDGANFIENTNYDFFLDSRSCIVVSRTLNQIVCQCQLRYDIPKGETQLEILANIGNVNFNNLIYTIYKPFIDETSPEFVRNDVDDKITVRGSNLGEASHVMVGMTKCNILKKSEIKIVCTLEPLSKKQPAGEYPVAVVVNGLSFSNDIIDPITFKDGPVLNSISPNYIFRLGIWELQLNGLLFSDKDEVYINGLIVDDIYKVSDNSLLITYDSSQPYATVGSSDVTVLSGSGGSPSASLTLTVANPVIVSVTPDFGYVYSETIVTITISQLPVMEYDDIFEIVKFKVKNTYCKVLSIDLETKEFQCAVQPNDIQSAETVPIFVSIKGIDYQTTKTFQYLDSTFGTLNQPDSLNPEGGVWLGEQMIAADKCTKDDGKINCIIPPNIPGDYPISLVSLDSFQVKHTYKPQGYLISYSGPSLISITPSQGSKMRRVHFVTLTGTGFGNNKDDISIAVQDGANRLCTNVLILESDTKIRCTILKIEPGVYPIVVSVRGVKTINAVTFRSNSLACLGPPEKDNTNSPESNDQSYLYIDSTGDTLKKLPYIQHTKTYTDLNILSPIEATFKQYSDYKYMFINDQIGTRDDKGVRIDIDKLKTEVFGHMKSSVIFDDNFSGLHIQHSNPLFPSYTTTDKSAFNGPAAGVKFLGLPTNSQHFFCYSFDNVETVAEYIVKNHGFLMEPNEIPDTVTQTDNPYLFSLKNPTNPTLMATLRTTCENNIKNLYDIEGICYWNSKKVSIGGMDAFYFMKIGTSNHLFKRDEKFKKPLSPYIISKRKEPGYLDGIDLWMRIADFFKQTYFVQMYHQEVPAFAPTKQVLNVAMMEFPQSLSLKDNQKYKDARFSGAKTGAGKEHSKLGFPIYPNYGVTTPDSLDNFFCVGDNNRHNGQGYRGGGALCFRHQTLVYQFNRMVRSYDTEIKNGITANSNSIGLFYTIDQPIKVRPKDWNNEIKIEVKDYIQGQYISKFPPQTLSVLPATINADRDLVINLKSLRTSKTFTKPNDETVEVSIPNAGQINPNQLDITDYVANDLLSIHYIAFDQAIGSVCDYSDLLFECTQDASRVTLIQMFADKPSVVFPVNYFFPYSQVQSLRNYDLPNNMDFKLLRFASNFMTKLPNAKNNFYQFMIGEMEGFKFLPPFIIRSSQDICEEEIAYLMTIHYIYYQSIEQTTLYSVGDNTPNWANGLILAISKKLYNNMKGTNQPIFDQCISNIVSNFDNIETYEDDIVDNPNDDILMKRSAAAAWDWMSTDSYSDGEGERVDKVNILDIIPVEELIGLMIRLSQDDRISNLDGLFYYVKDQYRSDLNFIHILNNHKLIQPNTNNVDQVFDNHFLNMMRIPRSKFSRVATQLSSQSNQQVIKSTILENEILLQSGLQQVLSFNSSSLDKFNTYQLQKLENSIGKWLSIDQTSQAIKVLTVDPQQQFHDQPIRFLEELNRDQIGNPLELRYESVGTTGTRVSLQSPISIVSITYLLESILQSKSNSKSQYGDLEIYYLPKPSGYRGAISLDLTGIIVATLNSQFCDIQMISESDYLSGNFDSLCNGIGPIITSVNQLTGSTNGGYMITINGIRFNSSMVVSIGENQCDSTEIVSSKIIVCHVPNGVGKRNEILISDDDTIFDIQRSKFIFSYDSPLIQAVQPVIRGMGDIMTINGSNFGTDATRVNIMIDERLECWPIVSLSVNSIQCLTPAAMGDHQTVTVTVGDQSSSFTIDTLDSQSFSFSGPQIIGISPESRDPNDTVFILGGFGTNDDDAVDLPLLFFDDKLVPIINSTDEMIEFQLEYETSTVPLVIQVGDQSIQTDFSYYPAIINQLNNQPIGTTGGVIEIDGAGFGNTFDNVKIKLNNSTEIQCSSFDHFLECSIPPGIGSNISISVQVSNQTIQFSENTTFSYLAPSITNYYIQSNNVYIMGSNFVPVEYGISFDTDTYIKLISNGQSSICTSFESSQIAVCPLLNQPLQSIQLFVAGQQSNIYTIYDFVEHQREIPLTYWISFNDYGNTEEELEENQIQEPAAEVFESFAILEPSEFETNEYLVLAFASGTVHLSRWIRDAACCVYFSKPSSISQSLGSAVKRVRSGFSTVAGFIEIPLQSMASLDVTPLAIKIAAFPMKLVNLCLFIRNNNKEILLGLKKRGFGVGKWDGCGGKVEPNESVEEGAIREAKEEFGLTPTTIYSNPKYVGGPMEHLENHVFIVTDWSGELVETDEMQPKWFDLEREGMPFKSMWPDFEIWFNYLKDNHFKAKLDFDFHFDEKDNIESYQNNSSPNL
ncbi:hypothetical protein PPL_01439 [Heterostelium album PN500]|uniref:Nudix hydrolase domain-containing protein n=1 Tax=Heterostelium pallidum (strain ATCC 26659 / Pp 5 / PN500) TaxID=670386 RepID=D3AZ99_HETP5|nr:hypothetical protein PPL_01439 [Heterostelium album PN500]EFA85482.1 hypothetical protein PPL_01439 [Heterostelium album PN500]|eukprot:XP_020437590.1 hypothetical protein PPL_01439 [Heterostelium album PN500]